MKNRIAFSLLVIFLLVLLSSTSFAEDDLSISRWIVKSNLLDNGDLVVEEDLTFDFKSNFNGVYRHIATNNTYGIENLKLCEVIEGVEIPYNLVNNAKNGDKEVFTIENENKDLMIKIFSPSKKNTSKTFRLKYIVKNVAIKHMDTGELYYKFIGNENPTPIKYFAANIKLPNSNIERTKIFAHGPSNGQIYFIEDNSIKMEVSDIPSNTFVEARILFPKNFIGESTRVGNNTFDNIIEEELSFIRKAEQKSASRKRNRALLEKFSLYITFVGFLIFNFVYRKLKRNPEIFEDLKTLTPEDISPSELRLFMSNIVDGRAIMTTIFDLARRGYLTIEEIEPKKKKNKDFLFSKTNIPMNELLPHEIHLLNWLFNTIGDGSIVSTIDIEEFRKKNFSLFNKDFNTFNKEIRNCLKNRGYNEAKSELGVLMIISSIIAFIIGVITLALESLYGLIPLLASTFILIYGVTLFTRKSDKGYIQYKLWKDFKNDLQNQKEVIDDYDISIPKDKTLIYALALGLPMKSIDRIRDAISDSYSPYHWSYCYFLTNKHGGSSFEDRFNSSFYGSSINSTSSSIGGGGGFSSGGGGGAGGGGAGGF